MKIILLVDVKGLGKKFEVLEVKPGFANNVLLPQNKALIANKKTLNQLKKDLKNIEKEKEKKRLKASQIIEALKNIEFIYKLMYHEGKIKGTVTSKMIQDDLKKKLNIEIDRKKIKIDHISKPGQYIAKLNLFENRIAYIRVIVKGIK